MFKDSSNLHSELLAAFTTLFQTVPNSTFWVFLAWLAANARKIINPSVYDTAMWADNTVSPDNAFEKFKRFGFIMKLGAGQNGHAINSLWEFYSKSIWVCKVRNRQKKPGSKIGQNLSSTFHLADFFVSTDVEFEVNLKNFLNLLFGNPYITPTRDEMHMYEAQAVAFRSADLSRQIGAVIVDRDGFVVARGCNEVPSANGGAHWQGDPPEDDNRDFVKGRDYNAVKKQDILKELLDFVDKNIGFFGADDRNTDELVKDLMFGKYSGEFKDLRISNLIEFGRVVHAEMHAIVEAARRGASIDGGTVYTTTFPCHMCGRHIIAANIDRVVYIEPYPKSMTSDLYDREVKIDGESENSQISERAVKFEPFIGVAPRFFEQLFSAPKRKGPTGYIIDWIKEKALPRCTGLSTSHLPREAIMATQVSKISTIDDPKVLENE